MSGLRIGSLFSGYGGLDMAVESITGARTAWVSDIDKGACKILAHRYPDVPNLGDLTAIDWAAVEPVDIITGGSPCQDLSHAGKRAGMTDGTRSNLWVSMREGIAIIRPAYVIWENVRGAYSACADSEVDSELGRCPRCLDPNSGAKHAPNLRALGRVLGDLSDLGYDAQWRGLRAADVGAPHGRFRVFVVARLADATSDARRIQYGNDGPVADSADDARGRRASTGTTGRRAGRLRLLPSPRTSDTNGAGRHGTGGLDLRTAVALLPTPDASPEKYRLRGDSQQSRGLVALGATGHDFGQYAEAIARWESATGRAAPSPTEPTGKGGANRLSPRFTEWMMGLPDGWITEVPGITRTEGLRACGNGVVLHQAYAAVSDCLRAEAVAAA